MAKLSEAQRRNLEHVRDHGRPTPRSRAAFVCRVNGWSEFIWQFGDGTVATATEKEPNEANGWLEKVVGERITKAGRRALENRDG